MCDAAFVCRLCLTMPRFREYEALRAHLRAIHGRPKLSLQDLPLYEVYPGSRYASAYFKSGESSQTNTMTSASASQTQAVAENQPENREQARENLPSTSGNQVRSEVAVQASEVAQNVITLAEIQRIIREERQNTADAGVVELRAQITSIQVDLVNQVKETVNTMLDGFMTDFRAQRTVSGGPNMTITLASVQNEPTNIGEREIMPATAENPSNDVQNTVPLSIDNEVNNQPVDEPMETLPTGSENVLADQVEVDVPAEQKGGDPIEETHSGGSPMNVQFTDSDDELLNVPEGHVSLGQIQAELAQVSILNIT